MKKPKLKNEEIAKQLEGDRWPHLETNQKWKQTADSFRRVCRMVKRLCELGMPMDEAVSMFRELYWCAYGDIKDMPKPQPVDERPRSGLPYFDEFGIMFRMNVADLTPEELSRDYEFYANLYIKKETVWWTNIGGGAGGGAATQFSREWFGWTATMPSVLQKKQAWPMERLAEVDAVGVYKRREPVVKTAKRPQKKR